MDSMDFSEVFAKTQKVIENYGIKVYRGKVFNDNTGDFNGNKIVVDERLEWDYAVSILAHLFGHTVQWNVSPELRKLGQENVSKPNTAELAAIYEYEKQATRYGMQLLHEAGVTSLDQWLTNMWRADWKWLEHFYATGERLDIETFFEVRVSGLLTPLPIPTFVPQEFESRWSF